VLMCMLIQIRVQPPLTFQPIIELTSQANVPTRDSSATASKPKQPDLIQRYNLDSKLRAAEAGSADQESPKVAWTTNKTDRQTALQKRREDMILAARRKMLEKEKEGKS
jgi:coupling of ubiquitin conjugation to ER degradation protein 1